MWGLITAIPSLLAYFFFKNRLNNLVADCHHTAEELLNASHPDRQSGRISWPRFRKASPFEEDGSRRRAAPGSNPESQLNRPMASTKLRAAQAGDGEELKVDMSPMIDMVFLLLIFFLVNATMIIVEDGPEGEDPDRRELQEAGGRQGPDRDQRLWRGDPARAASATPKAA